MGSVPLRDPVRPLRVRRLPQKRKRKLFLPFLDLASVLPSFAKQSEARKMVAQFQGGRIKEGFLLLVALRYAPHSCLIRTQGQVSGSEPKPPTQPQLFGEYDFDAVRLSRWIVVVSSPCYLDLLLLSGANRSFRFRSLSPPSSCHTSLKLRPRGGTVIPLCVSLFKVGEVARLPHGIIDIFLGDAQPSVYDGATVDT